ncbi:hypothetical protein K461DRAFT_97132 [Myriangium duriaei CBS 260.36]|uniref:Uncharacterized protein n=1 Tax=Myriangium duriaei CBS 260.36 TaxID=1168546 RepID=A0A9P4J7X2_9PEZI|nr:hypothetical protein K461DRAFT_97132 [Myriangium duriaei CBS 260.36]
MLHRRDHSSGCVTWRSRVTPRRGDFSFTIFRNRAHSRGTISAPSAPPSPSHGSVADMGDPFLPSLHLHSRHATVNVHSPMYRHVVHPFLIAAFVSAHWLPDTGRLRHWAAATPPAQAHLYGNKLPEGPPLFSHSRDDAHLYPLTARTSRL